MLDGLRHTQLVRKDHYILLGTAGAAAALALLLFDMVQQMVSSPENSTGRITVFVLAVQGLCCLGSFLGHVYRSLAGRPGLLTALSVCAVLANLGLLLGRAVHEIIFSGYMPEQYSEAPQFEDVTHQSREDRREWSLGAGTSPGAVSEMSEKTMAR